MAAHQAAVSHRTGLESFCDSSAGFGERPDAVRKLPGPREGDGAGEMSGLERAFMGSARRLEILTGSGGFRPFGDRDAMARMRKSEHSRERFGLDTHLRAGVTAGCACQNYPVG
jgi:hypothetical protein